MSTLSFLSSDKKRCTRVCNVSYRNWKKTKCLFPPSEWTNDFGLKDKVLHLKKLVFQSGVSFLFQCIFQHGHCPLVDFWRIWSGNFLFFWQFGILIPWYLIFYQYFFASFFCTVYSLFPHCTLVEGVPQKSDFVFHIFCY